MSTQMIDYTSEYKDNNSFDTAVLYVQGKGSNVLILRELDTPFRRSDGKRGKFELEHRWLSQRCANEADQAWCCVQGSEFTYWMVKELPELMKLIKKDQASSVSAVDVDLFEHFNLF